MQHLAHSLFVKWNHSLVRSLAGCVLVWHLHWFRKLMFAFEVQELILVAVTWDGGWGGNSYSLGCCYPVNLWLCVFY